MIERTSMYGFTANDVDRRLAWVLHDLQRRWDDPGAATLRSIRTASPTAPGNLILTPLGRERFAGSG